MDSLQERNAMSSTARRVRGSVALAAALTLVTMGPGVASASADEDSLAELLTTTVTGGQDTATLDGTKQSGTLATPSSPPPAPTSDDDLAGHETADPAPPDHGQATIAHTSIGGRDIATVGDNKATVEDDDSTKADSTLIAIGGEEILGTHADSEGANESHFGDPLAPVCEGSDGQVCLQILYADAWATDDGTTSSSRSQSGVADVCLGGDDAAPDAECSGPVAAGVSTSTAEAERDQESGRTTAGSESNVADACVEEDPVTGGCAVGVGVLHSSGSSDSGSSPASAERDSYLLRLDLGGEERGRVGDPQALSLPPDCPEGASLVCLFLNQGETYVGDGIAGHAQEALHVDVLPGNLDLEVHLARTESLVHNDGGEPSGDDDEVAPDEGVADGPGDGEVAGVEEVAGVAGVLPNTGGVWSGLLALGLLGVGLGSLLMARRRLAGVVTA